MKRSSRWFSRESSQRHDFLFSDAANRHGVQANLAEADALCRGDAIQHARQAFSPGNALERFLRERIEADIQAVQAGSFERRRLVREQDAVGRQRNVADGGHGSQHAHQNVQIAAHQGLAAGQPDFVDP